MDVNQVKWGSYSSFEGPWVQGHVKCQAHIGSPSDMKLLAVAAAAEGGHMDAVNMYDSCILSAGAIQWCESANFGVSDMLGEIVSQCPQVLDHLTPALEVSKAEFLLGQDGRWRFSSSGKRADSKASMRSLFLSGSSGKKGGWSDKSRLHAKVWAACISSALADPRSPDAQARYSARRLDSFVSSSAREILYGPASPPRASGGLVGAARAVFLSFAINLPAVASKHLQIFVEKSSDPKWSEAWTFGLARQLSLGPGIAIYPGRYAKMQPWLQSLYGVDFPDISPKPKNLCSVEQVQLWLISQGFDLGPGGADGVFGKKTKQAVTLFQKSKGLVADGIIGPKTIAALEKSEAERTF